MKVNKATDVVMKISINKIDQLGRKLNRFKLIGVDFYDTYPASIRFSIFLE